MTRHETTEPVTRQLLSGIVEQVRPLTAHGAVATYIPALAAVPAHHLGLAVWRHGSNEVLGAGDADVAFSVQSISKVFTLALALRHGGVDRLWARVGREPSGDPFNSIALLEREQGVPRNPFINAGAIVVADLLCTLRPDPVGDLVAFVSELAGEPVAVDGVVAASEAATGYRNRALANMIRSFGNLDNDTEAVLDVYFRQCSLAMTASQLARAVRFLANDGIDPATGVAVLRPTEARHVNALMLMAGTYDAAGAFAYEIGIPCKSGVGGGIVGVVPDRATVCAWSPALDATGNSLAARAALAALVARTGLTVF